MQMAWFFTDYDYYRPFKDFLLKSNVVLAFFLKNFKVLEFLIDKGISFQME